MTTVRISERTRLTLRALARERGESSQAITDQAVELFRRQSMLDRANEGFAAVHADPTAWAAEQAERAMWDGTLDDGLEEE
ncbi:MAG: toxin-antitoxin system protein [Herpetosiphonaceae bacterium]|nr:toxin-antitoxin system protein [Herpetosiphonaceae bacterium]